jgi:beta-xylosidase
MKKYTLGILLVCLFVACTPQKPPIYLFSFFQNNGEDGLHLAYSYDALKWQVLKGNQSFLTPKVGGDKLMRDPCIIKGGDGKFHMVWTVSWNEKGIGYASSQDLINWSAQQYIPVMEHEPQALNCWAPELYYDEASEEYMIYWATTIPDRFTETAGTGDNKYNHRMYYTTTKDFVDFSEAKLLYDQGFNVIDATIHKANGIYNMFLKNETLKPQEEKNIRIATSKNLTGPYSQASEPITDNWVEGPTAVETEKGWLVYYDQYTRHQMGAVLSKDLKNWEDISDSINFPEGTRHGTVIKVENSILEGLMNATK